MLKSLSRYVIFTGMLFAVMPILAQNATLQAEQWMQKGENAAQTGALAEQVEAWTQAAQQFQEQGNRFGQGTALLRRGETYLAAGYHDEALDDIQRALDIEQTNGEKARIAAVKASLGNAFYANGRLDEAEETLNEALALANEINQADVLSVALNNIANLRVTQGNYAEAGQAYRKSVELARQIGDHELAVGSLLNAANLAALENQASRQRTLINQALQEAEQLPDKRAKTFALLRVGHLLQSNNSQSLDDRTMALAYQSLEQARKIAEASGDLRLASYAYGYLARLYQRSARYNEALMLNSKAVFLAQQIDAPDVLYLWHWQAGQLYDVQGDIDGAITAYRRAVSDLDPIRTDLLSGYRGQSSAFREVLSPLYLELADLLLQRAPTLNDRLSRQTYLIDARKTVEQLKTVELQDYFLDQCVTNAQSKATGLDHQLPAGTAVLYPILLPDRAELLLSLPSGIQQFTVGVSADTLTREIREFRTLLEKRTTYQYFAPGERLYDWLIRPLEATLADAQVETLVVVPDGPLRTIPFAALYDGDRYLIEKYAIATTPGLTLTDASPLQQQRLRVLVCGLSDAVQGFPALPAVGSELSMIQDIFGENNGTLLKDQSFNLGNIEQELTKRPYNIVHIASHGQFESDIRKSFLLTYNEKLDMNRLEEYMQLRRFSEQPVELLTLSACQTAAGDDRAALGLAGIAIKAGARSALGTLWFVNDEASSILVSDFYRQLRRQGLSKAKALQYAQRALVRTPESRLYKHPGYWSPFLLIGNWL